jgi:hypothetical protein
VDARVTVATFESAMEAHIVKGLFESVGIPARLAGVHMIEANALLAPILGGVHLEVAARDHERAKILLARYQAGEFSEAAGDDASPELHGT